MSEHSRISPSGLHRVLNCPGSVRLSAGIPSPSSKYAMEGRAAHYIAQCCLEQGVEAEKWRGRYVTLEENRKIVKVVVPDEMVEHVQNHVDMVRAKIEKAASPVVFVEQTLNMSWLGAKMKGTSDTTIIEPLYAMEVIDLKYGAGIAVEAETNAQLMTYGLGALGQNNEHMVGEVTLTISQPRAPHPDGPTRSWSISADDLYQWAKAVLMPGIKDCDDPNAKLVAGDWCRWCPAYKEVCTLPRKQMFEVIGVETDALAIPKKPAFPDVKGMTAEQMGKVAAAMDAFLPWAKAFDEALFTRLKAGDEIPGRKLVWGRKTRIWKNEKQVEETLSFLGKDLYDVKVKTVASMEKHLKEQGKTIPDGLVEEKKGVVVVPEGDKRQAVNPVLEMFGEPENE